MVTTQIHYTTGVRLEALGGVARYAITGASQVLTLVDQVAGNTGNQWLVVVAYADESSTASEHGTTIVDAAVPQHAIQDALDKRPEFIASHVSMYKVRRTPVLKVAVTCRRGVSPRDAATIVESKLRALDELLGRELPALIQISGGLRARATRTTRLQ